MEEGFIIDSSKSREQTVIELTSYLLHKHYCENDVEAIVEWFDDSFTWIGTAEHEYGVGNELVAEIFREFEGKVPKCDISDEHYDVIEITPEVYVVSGRLWIATAPSEDVYLRVHQRISTVFHWNNEKLRCSHIHISNPYIEMDADDVGFPTKMAKQSYEYLQECVEEQKKKIAEQTAELTSIYNTVPCVITRVFRHKKEYGLLTFNRALVELLGKSEEEIADMDWTKGFCYEVMEEDVTAVEKSLESSKKVGDFSCVDYRGKNSLGEWRYLSSNNLLVHEDERGQVIQKIAFDITKRAELEIILQKKSYEDSLTGLFNRNKFNQEMENHQEKQHLGVVCLDINGLKEVNDRWGHRAGDDLICRTAKHISRHFSGRAYRIGGDEFVVMDSDRNEEEFWAVINALRVDMEQDEIHVSVGVSWRDSGCNPKEQLHEADMRMYEDKTKYYSDKKHDRRKR